MSNDKNKKNPQSTGIATSPGVAIEKQAAPGALAEYDFGEDAGGGYENQDSHDRSLPFINVLQSNSPIVEKGDNPAARAGCFINTATGDLYPGQPGILVVPCLTHRVFLEFRMRTKGGGFRGRHEPDAHLVLEAQAKAEKEGTFGKMVSPANPDNELVEAFELFMLLFPDVEDLNTWYPSVFAFTSMKIKHYKNWNTRLGQVQVPAPGGRKQIPPLWVHQTRISTVDDQNEKGRFKNVKVEPFVENDFRKSMILNREDPRYVAAKAFRDFALSGDAKIGYEKGDASGGADGGAPAPNEGRAPF